VVLRGWDSQTDMPQKVLDCISEKQNVFAL
jgi:hypothetical protein